MQGQATSARTNVPPVPGVCLGSVGAHRWAPAGWYSDASAIVRVSAAHQGASGMLPAYLFSFLISNMIPTSQGSLRMRALRESGQDPRDPIQGLSYLA